MNFVEKYEKDIKNYPIDCVVSFSVYTGNKTEPEVIMYGEVIGHYRYIDLAGAIVRCNGEQIPRNVPFDILMKQRD